MKFAIGWFRLFKLLLILFSSEGNDKTIIAKFLFLKSSENTNDDKIELDEWTLRYLDDNFHGLGRGVFKQKVLHNMLYNNYVVMQLRRTESFLISFLDPA